MSPVPPLQEKRFPNGMTVAELKALVRDWPETDQHGEPCEVWLFDQTRSYTNQAVLASPLNMRRSEDGTKLWADLVLGPRGRDE
jgi:hypothetical protein